LADQPDVLQIARGRYIAQAAPGGTATVVHYEFTPATPVDDETFVAAARKLEQLPIDVVPAVAPLPPGSRVPLAPNPLFTGRRTELTALAAALKPASPDELGTPGCAAVTGIPGTGKTQLATEFVHRYGGFFSGGVYWLTFADPSAIANEIAACGSAGRMDLRPDFGSLPLEDRTRLVMSTWQSRLPRLLVFDNCEDEALLAQWRPPSGGCRVVVTSRREQWDPAAGVALVPLDVLDARDGVTLLQRYRPDLASQDPAVAGIADELGNLPLALHLAGSYLWRYREATTPEAYLNELRRTDVIVHRSLTQGGLSPTGHEQDVGRTFAVSYKRLDPATPADALAEALLARAAHFALGEVIPRPLLVATARQESKESSEPNHELLAEDALARLLELGLLQTAPEAGVRLHRLLGSYVLADADLPGALEAVENQLIKTFSEVNAAGDVLRGVELEPHLRAVTDAALERQTDLQARELGNVLGNHLRANGQLAEATSYLRRALEGAVALYGTDHPALARDLNDLGLALLREGSHAEARRCFEAALPRWTQLNDQPNYAASLDNLGQLAHDEGDLATAERCFTRALAIREETLGLLNPQTAVTLTNLGSLRLERGEFEAALDYFVRSLKARQRTLGEAHPSTGLSYYNEAEARRLAGDIAAARGSLERAVHAYTTSLGEMHPRTLRALASLAAVVDDEGDHERADDLLVTVAKGRAGLVATPTPWTGTMLNNLGYLLWTRGEFVPARDTYLDAISVDERVRGLRHLNLGVIFNNLGMVCQWLEEQPAARHAYERALQIIDGSQPTALSMRVGNNYGLMLVTLGELEAARHWLEAAYADRSRILGKEHPDTAITLANLGRLLEAERNPDEACRVTQRAVSIVRGTPGQDRTLAWCLHDHGVALARAGRFDAAAEALTEALALRERALHALHPEIALTLCELGEVDANRGRAVVARGDLNRASAICDARLPARVGGEPEHSLTRRVREALARLAGEPSD
jgi:tetratricopeptide (TPR) repeat protein